MKPIFLLLVLLLLSSQAFAGDNELVIKIPQDQLKSDEILIKKICFDTNLYVIAIGSNSTNGDRNFSIIQVLRGRGIRHGGGYPVPCRSDNIK